ncbi:Protein of unknown function DUF598 [Thioalkalivibrio nitratireducens DSM 14787]|uniref:Uncharacterized protein n=1 Tax=Thioalkalivibrio nitratireducens (strain DSM 14787 / UNIQEM 213 / ALEN2) TaxID=1255043 RepID=L0E1T2_THIND|nr:Mth938-like domain-containing protein [Thioalkalivibrio nitratireducens]AGA34591.1 Protein of unknown function DUF598 [Thioalkalivibrio nitratireducens DSM 14787]
MQFTQITADDRNLITGYAPDHVAVNGVRHTASLILRPNRLLTEWPVTGLEALTPASLEWLHPDPPEILLIGTGTCQAFPEPALWTLLREPGWGLEFMDTAAACRTYNLIMAEGRTVAAALIVESGAREQHVL